MLQQIKDYINQQIEEIIFLTIMSGEFQEIEFHPNNVDTMYFIKQTANYTEFYRSDDNGNT